MPLHTPIKGRPSGNQLVVCAGTVTCQSVASMDSGFIVFKQQFKSDTVWTSILQQALDGYHKKGKTLAPYMHIAKADKLVGGVATVPEFNGKDLKPSKKTTQQEQYKNSIRGAIEDALGLGRPLFIQPLGIGVYGWDPVIAAGLFADVIAEIDPKGNLDITIPIFDNSPSSKDSLFKAEIERRYQLISKKPIISDESVMEHLKEKDTIVSPKLPQQTDTSPKLKDRAESKVLEKLLIQTFYKRHRALQNEKNWFYSFFIKSIWQQNNQAQSIDAILKHAINDRTTLGYRNRSFEACVSLGWLTELDNGDIVAGKNLEKDHPVVSALNDLKGVTQSNLTIRDSL